MISALWHRFWIAYHLQTQDARQRAGAGRCAYTDWRLRVHRLALLDCRVRSMGVAR